MLRGNKISLVPYLREHVEVYNGWMKSQELLEMTASEPLTLEEEYAMQASWRIDEKKCTFIILAHNSEMSLSSLSRTETFATEGGMIGDCNYYCNVDEEPYTAEIEIMIAETSVRRKGLAQEALKMFFVYGHQELGITKMVAKISLNNIKSLKLFQEKFGFVEVSRSDIFQEATLEVKVKDLAWTATSEADNIYMKIHLPQLD